MTDVPDEGTEAQLEYSNYMYNLTMFIVYIWRFVFIPIFQFIFIYINIDMVIY